MLSLRNPAFLSVIIVLLLWGAAGCSRPTLPRWLGGAAPTSTPTPIRVTTELELWHWPSTPNEVAYQQGLVDAFHQRHPTVVVTLNYPNEYERRLRTALGTDSPPDLIALNLAQLPDLVAAELLAPLPTELLTDSDLYAHLRDAMQVDGVPYCFPQSFHTLALFYNKAYFDAAALPYPDESWQWETLRNAAETLTDPETGQFGLVLSADFSRWLAFLYQAGGTITIADDTITNDTMNGEPLGNRRRMAINSPEATIALDYYSNLVNEGVAATPSMVDSRWPGEAFARSKAAMIIEGSWLVPFLAADVPDLVYGIAPLPAGPTASATLSFATCLATTAASPNREAALVLLTHLSTVEAMAGRMMHDNALPARRSLQEEWRATYPDQVPFIAQTSVAREWQLPVGFQPWLSERNDELRRIFGGFIPANALLPAAESQGNELLVP